MGRFYWGRYYLIGLGHFLLGTLMPLSMGVAPLVYGVFVAVYVAASAWDHYHAARPEKPRS